MTVEDVLVELENSESESDDNSSESEDDFEGYLDENMEETLEDDSEENSEDEQSYEDQMDTVNPSIPQYTGQPGISVPISGDRPHDLFSLFVDRNMLQHIVEQTNLCAEQYIASHSLSPRSRIRQWTKQDHTLSELQRFIALILVMGLVRYPKLESHWSTSWPYATEAFSSVSSYNKII